MKRVPLVILLFAFALGSSSFGADKVKVGMAIKVAPEYYLPADAATERGFFKQAGLEAEIVPFMAGAAFSQAIAAGAIDLGLTATGSTVHLASQGVPVMIVEELISKAPFVIYVRGDSKIKEPKDLAGVKIGVPRLGSISEFLGRAVVRGLGIEKDVKFIGAGGLSEILAGLKTGVLDAIVQPPTVAINMKVKGEIKEIANTADFLPKEWTEHVLNARTEFAAKNPEVVRRAAKAILQGTDYIRKNPRWAMDKMKTVSSFSEEGAREIYNFIKFTNDGKISRAALENIVNFMVEWKIVPQDKVPALDQLYSERFLK